jgi:peroxiredoxin
MNDYYLQKLTPQVPDTICQAAYDLANASGEGTEIYRYVIQYTVNTYDKKKVMGMDAVFVCLASKVYCQDKAFWLEEDRVEEICDRYSVMKNLTIGQKAENIVLPDEKGYWTSLYDVKAKYTVLIFWASDCGHCKKEMPKLLEAYHENKDKGLKVFAVSTQFENEDWVKFIKKDSLDWINVSDNPEINENAWWYIQNGFTTLNSLNFRDYWDIFSTPQVYILDENKEIIGKKIGAEQITDFLSKYDEEFETAKPEIYPNNNGKSDVNYKEALPKIGEAPQGTE